MVEVIQLYFLHHGGMVAVQHVEMQHEQQNRTEVRSNIKHVVDPGQHLVVTIHNWYDRLPLSKMEICNLVNEQVCLPHGYRIWWKSGEWGWVRESSLRRSAKLLKQ